MKIKWWSETNSDELEPTMQRNVVRYYLLVASGILFATTLYFVLNHGPTLKQLRHHIPENHFIQLRDEFPVLSNFVPDYDKYKSSDDEDAVEERRTKDLGEFFLKSPSTSRF